MTPADRRRALTPLHAYGGLTVLVGHLLIAPYGLNDVGSPISAVVQATFFILLILVLIQAATHPAQLALCLGLIAAATTLGLSFPSTARIPRALADLGFVACGIVAMWLSMTKIIKTRSMTGSLITASIGLYLLAGIIWAIAFDALVLVAPGSISNGDSDAPVSPADLYYFSFVTLTTLGFGDISPVSPFARSLAIVEAVFGQVFLVVLLGRLVSVQVSAMQLPQPRRDLSRIPE